MSRKRPSYREHLLGELAKMVRERKRVPLAEIVKMTGYCYRYVKYYIVRDLSKADSCVKLVRIDREDFLEWRC